jgi:hypothetical protein
MTFGNLAERPDLQPLFGALSAEQNDELLDRLLAIDAELTSLAELASAHVGVPYRALGLGLVLRSDGTAAGIHGGPSGDAGDIWFDISLSGDPVVGRSVGPPWVVESRLVVFCSDSPEPRGDANTHDLVRLKESANTPAAVLDVLESHVSVMRIELDRHPRELFTITPHSQLP